MDLLLEFLPKLLALPYAPLILILIFVVLVAMLIGGLLKFILRILFKPVRFLLCVAIVLVIMCFVGYSLYNNPILPTPIGEKEGEILTIHNEKVALEEVANHFKGLFSEDLPLLAWRISPKSREASVPDGLYNLDAAPPVTVQIEYLPIGNMTVQYDPKTGKIDVLEGLSDGEANGGFSSLLKLFDLQSTTEEGAG